MRHDLRHHRDAGAQHSALNATKIITREISTFIFKPSFANRAHGPLHDWNAVTRRHSATTIEWWLDGTHTGQSLLLLSSRCLSLGGGRSGRGLGCLLRGRGLGRLLSGRGRLGGFGGGGDWLGGRGRGHELGAGVWDVRSDKMTFDHEEVLRLEECDDAVLPSVWLAVHCTRQGEERDTLNLEP